MKLPYLVVGIILGLLASMSIISWAFGMINSPSDVTVAIGILTLAALSITWIWVIKKIQRTHMVSARSATPFGGDNNHHMLLVVTMTAFSLFGGGCTRVDPGHVGIEVDMYGKDRGVQEYTLLTGRVWYNPVNTSIFEYPTFVQTAVWTKDPNEGSPNNEEISFNSKEGMVITGDISLSYQLDAKKIPAFYVKFRSDDLNTFTHGFLRNVARDAFNETASQYPVEEIYGVKKEELLQRVRQKINDQVGVVGVHLEQFGFIGAPRLPKPVVDALNAKITATQNAITAENQLRQAEAEARKTVAKAEGDAKANQILTSSLTPGLIQWRQLEIQEKAVGKWSGALPLYSGSGTIPFIQLPTSAPSTSH